MKSCFRRSVVLVSVVALQRNDNAIMSAFIFIILSLLRSCDDHQPRTQVNTQPSRLESVGLRSRVELGDG